MFASSGGAVTALALVAAYPNDVTTLVAHEPPLIPVLPDAAAAERARAGVRDAYEAKGSGAGMAAFIAMTSWRGQFTDDYFAQPAPDPAQFGMPTDDDGSRDDPLLSDRSCGDHQLPPRRRRADRGADPHRDRSGRGVREHVHRTHDGGHRRTARAAGDGVPEPPRRLPRRRVRIRRPTRSLRAHAARRPGLRRLTPFTSRVSGGSGEQHTQLAGLPWAVVAHGALDDVEDWPHPSVRLLSPLRRRVAMAAYQLAHLTIYSWFVQARCTATPRRHRRGLGLAVVCADVGVSMSWGLAGGYGRASRDGARLRDSRSSLPRRGDAQPVGLSNLVWVA